MVAKRPVARGQYFMHIQGENKFNIMYISYKNESGWCIGHCNVWLPLQKKTKKNKKNVDIKFNAHDTFLKLPSSGTLKITFLRYAQNYLPQVTLKITFLRYAQNYLPRVRSKLPSSGTLKVEKLENQICFLKSFGATKTNGLNRITKIC